MKRSADFLTKLRQVTFVTKSSDMGEGKLLPKGHKILADMEKERQEHKKNGDIFAEVFGKRLGSSGLKVEHLPITEFLKWGKNKADFDGHLVCTLGGDGTFIQTSQNIWSSKTFTLGINPEPRNSIGYLCGYSFDDSKHIKSAAEDLANCLEKSKFDLVVRPRVKVINVTRPDVVYPLCSSL